MPRPATMKDVALAAGVSVGTVSNVLKGDRRVSLSMVRRVQAAIRATGYRGHAPLRPAAKLRRSRTVGVVLPSVQDAGFAGIFTGINHVCAENGFSASLCLSSEIRSREQGAIERFVRQRADGIVLVTCQPDAVDMFRSVVDSGTPLVFVERAPASDGFPRVEYDSARHLERLARGLLAEGRAAPLLVTGPLEYSNEAASVRGLYAALGARAEGAPRERFVVETNYNKESAFSAMVARLASGPPPDVVIATSPPLLAGARRAVTALELERRPEFVCLGEDSWAPLEPRDARIMRRDAMEMGEAAATMLLDIIDGDGEARERRLVVNNARLVAEPPPPSPAPPPAPDRPPLRLLMLAGAACQAVEALLPAFTKSSGLEVDIARHSVVDIAQILRDPAERRRYDILQIDQPWLGETAEDGMLRDLDAWLEANPRLRSSWLPGVLDAYCRHKGHYYTVPFLFGSQLLFYRKDLFDDPDLRSRFRKRFRYDLRAPKTWTEFNQIAEFFSRAHTPDSPVEFGVTLGGQEPNGAVCEFIPRFHAFREEAATAEGLIASLSGPEAEAALANYVESYRYAPPGAADFWWDDQAELFGQGRAAMMILFLGHVSTLADRSRSTVVGKVGYDIIPGGRPMLGGWTLGINRDSPHAEAALEFLAWVSGPELAIPLTILGGSPPAARVYHNSELCALYPWLPKAVESFTRSSLRNVSKATTGGRIEERVFERILGGAVHQAALGLLVPAEALAQAREELLRLIEPEN